MLLYNMYCVCSIKTWVVLLTMAVLGASCRRTASPRAVDGQEEQADTVGMTDTLVTDSLPEPPRAADGLFDDFVYSFMNNRRFQYERIVFPLRHVVDGKERFVSREEWKFNRLYSKEDIYLQVYANARQAKAEKDTALSRVTVDCIDFDRRRVEQYIFARVQRQWHLVEIDAHALGRHADSEFYTFYNRFATSWVPRIYFCQGDTIAYLTVEKLLTYDEGVNIIEDLILKQNP